MKSLELKKNISLSNFTTLRIGGPAEWIAQPINKEEIQYLINWVNQKQLIIELLNLRRTDFFVQEFLDL